MESADGLLVGAGCMVAESLVESELDEFSFLRPGRARRDRLCEEDERDMGRRKRERLASDCDCVPGESDGSGSL